MDSLRFYSWNQVIFWITIILLDIEPKLFFFPFAFVLSSHHIHGISNIGVVVSCISSIGW